jgi:hypothetical protein
MYSFMKNSGQAAIRKVLENPSWFREHPHYWASASLPFAYAMACVEIVSKSSEKARILYNGIIEAWSDAGIRAIFDEIASIKPDVIEDDSYLLTTGQTWGCLPFHAYITV